MCDAEGCTDLGCGVHNSSSAPPTILLLPPQFSVLNESRLPELVRLLNIGELRRDAIGALTFGAEIPAYKDGMLPTAPKLRYAFPTAPTWQVRQPPPGSSAEAHHHLSTLSGMETGAVLGAIWYR